MKFIIFIIAFLIGVIALSLISKFIRERHIRHCRVGAYQPSKG